MHTAVKLGIDTKDRSLFEISKEILINHREEALKQKLFPDVNRMLFMKMHR